VSPGGTHVYSSNAHPLSPSDETVRAAWCRLSLCCDIDNTSCKHLHRSTNSHCSNITVKLRNYWQPNTIISQSVINGWSNCSPFMLPDYTVHICLECSGMSCHQSSTSAPDSTVAARAWLKFSTQMCNHQKLQWLMHTNCLRRQWWTLVSLHAGSSAYNWLSVTRMWKVVYRTHFVWKSAIVSAVAPECVWRAFMLLKTAWEFMIKQTSNNCRDECGIVA